jgi:hypothetical protein
MHTAPYRHYKKNCPKLTLQNSFKRRANMALVQKQQLLNIYKSILEHNAKYMDLLEFIITHPPQTTGMPGGGYSEAEAKAEALKKNREAIICTQKEVQV